ncbi:XAC2610-related protein [Mucilaginibacter angelicae]|uniref:XAC2610-related protein n=1 Tax=Mucilaginibacter angelicae TaxID=869718 RepID=A0ABV6LCY9_9SPHI
MNLIAIVCIILSSHFQSLNNALNAGLSTSVAQSQGKTFKVQSLPFDLNGLRLQYQYTVKEDINSANPKEMVLVLDKKLVDLKRNVVVLDFPIEQEDLNPTINLSDINKVKYSHIDFDDVNFDGYKDIREECKLCSGSLGNVEEIYLFNRDNKKFVRWQSVMGINVELDEKSRTVQCYTKGAGDGQFEYQEIKFIDHGIQLYEKRVNSIFLNEKKHTYRITYKKYAGKKLVAHKARIVTRKEIYDPWDVIAEITK